MVHIDLVNQPKVLIPENAGVRNGAFNDRAGEIIRYKAGRKPEYLTGPSMPSGMDRNIDRIRQEMNDLAGMQNASLGKSEGANESGVAIRSRAAQDIDKLQVTESGVEVVFAAVFRDALLLFQEHLTEPRSMRIFDTYGSAVFSQLDSTRLVEDPEVRIDPGSLFATRSKDTEARTMSRLEAGLITPDEAKEIIQLNAGRKEALELLQDINEGQELLNIAKTGSIGIDNVWASSR